METVKQLNDYIAKRAAETRISDAIPVELYSELGVKRGLRDEKGRGVLTGLTSISRIDSSTVEDGMRMPIEGRLYYRGYAIEDIIERYTRDGFGFEKATYLLLFGKEANEEELAEFLEIMSKVRNLPKNFTRDIIMKAPSQDIMNSMTRSILTLASYDKNALSVELENCIRQSLMLIATFPLLALYAYHAHNHYNNNKSMYIHRPKKNLSTAENILRLLRPNKQYTATEARVLDACLMLHMEHGGGNNSTFTTRVVTSSGSDTYSAIAAGMSSLKGPKHGGANIKVMQMIEDIKAHVKHPTDKAEVRAYLEKIVDKEAFDGKGLIYGMGHAVYSISDPREKALKRFVLMLCEEKHMEKELALYENIEELAPQIIAEKRHIYKGISPNVDFYSGFVYNMLGIPKELFTPLFAIARISGWSAHRLEELISDNRITRPAYMSVIEIDNTFDPNVTWQRLHKQED